MHQRNKLIILGAGGHGKVVLDIASQQFNTIMIYDDSYSVKSPRKILGLPIVGNTEDLVTNKKPDEVFIVAIGDNAIRSGKYNHLLKNQLSAAEFFPHPSATIAKSVSIGQGSVVMAGACINPDAVIGCNVIINTGVVVEHDCKVDDHVHLAPNSTLCGNAEIGAYTWIGAGSTVIEGVKVGNNCVIGAGTVVTQDIPPYTLAVGIPAKPIRQLDEAL